MDNFRNSMLNDKRIEKVTDFFDSATCFPGVDISGGVCYFLWSSTYSGNCLVKSVIKDKISNMIRPLLENDAEIFIRFNEAVSVVRKVQSNGEKKIFDVISSRKPFGFETIFEGKKKTFKDAIKIHTSRGVEYVAQSEIVQNFPWVKEHKVYISYAYGERGSFPYLVLGKPFVGEPNTCCTETYLLIDPFKNRQESENVISYMGTKFFRFLVLLKKNTQHATKNAYSFVPTQDFTQSWTDEKLYAKYGLSLDEIAFIESIIRPMDVQPVEG